MRPAIQVTVDGTPVAGAFYERLVSLSVTDKDGLKSDTVDIELNDGPPAFLAIPPTGAIITVKVGYGNALVSLGDFTVDKVKLKCMPYRMTISGKAADMRSGKLKERQERSWDNRTLGDIVGDIARESNLTPALDPGLASYRYDWIAQQDETNLHFLRRLAERHNGFFSIKQGRLLFSKAGSGLSASGASLGTIVVTPEIAKIDSINVEIADRTKYSKVVAYYQDQKKAERVEIEADGDADGDSVFRIPDTFASPDEADKAAQAKAKSLKRGEGAASVTVIGDPSVCAGAPLLFSRIRPGVDGVPYVIDTATHKYSKTEGYTTDISAKLYDGKSATETDEDGGSGSGNSGSSTKTSEAGKVAPNAATGTPATPTSFLAPRRYGRTDEN